jgi:hypothetical protein
MQPKAGRAVDPGETDRIWRGRPLRRSQ